MENKLSKIYEAKEYIAGLIIRTFRTFLYQLLQGIRGS